MMSVVVLLMGNRTDPALAAKATPKSNRFTTVSSKPDEADGLHTLHSIFKKGYRKRWGGCPKKPPRISVTSGNDA